MSAVTQHTPERNTRSRALRLGWLGAAILLALGGVSWVLAGGNLIFRGQNGQIVESKWDTRQLPVKFILPKEGAVFSPITVNLVAGRPNQDLALKFIDYSLRAEASAGWAEALRYSPVNRKAKLSAEAAAQVLSGEEATKGLTTFDPIKISEMRAKWTEEWNRAIAK